MYGCFSQDQLSFIFHLSDSTKSLYGNVLCILQQNPKSKFQAYVPLGHPYLFLLLFFYVHKTATWNRGACSYLKVSGTTTPHRLLYLFCFLLYLFQINFHVLCFYYNLGDVITQLLHCPGSHFYISFSLRSAFARAIRRFFFVCLFCLQSSGFRRKKKKKILVAFL